MGASLGWSVAVGDFLGSADLDVAVGAAGENLGIVNAAGRVYVFEGPQFANVVGITAPLPEIGGGFGRALVAADFDGDGRAARVRAACWCSARAARW